ncbi:leucine--tRNA ligase [Clostridium sp. CAG:470]|jgi:leucyl-tRNA synthetase|nr:MAG: leucine--tRNA ligase [Clostridium sp. 28_17]CDE14603.1 leucine--tRNA ligase [Clostridium sp. CAG:470]
MAYNFKEIEKKWQEKWDKEGTFNAKDDYTMKKWYGLIEFPYPSGQGLHVGHPRSYTALDIIARKRRLQGYNVLFPIGFDAFGLPAENYAIKTNVHPKITTAQNIAHFTEQLKSLGFSFDWSRKIDTTDPEYYKWTQWIFIQLYKHGLAYKTTMPINFCTGCKVGLANEEVVNGVCERCGSPVVQKEKSEWMLKITDYAQKLIDDLDDIDFLEKIKVQQKNWIGRSEGAEVNFKIANMDKNLTVYTTRPDTLFGATYMVISPEHPILKELEDKIKNLDEVKEYQKQASLKSAFERSELNKEKTGVEIKGINAINPLTNKEIPIWISDYVLITYGTGAIMAVPAHDTRDYEFAKKFNLPIVQVVDGENVDLSKEAFTDVATGKLINSDFLNGLEVAEAKKTVIKYLEDNHIGTKKVNYKLRDWVFSRQRYWGEPIPMVYCEDCGWVPVDEKDLPLKLPEVEEFTPGENGESPLAKQTDWINTTCPHCGKPAKRETDTMPQWAGSSWYYLRYMDPHNDKELASKEALKYWSPVDWYNGGMEHTTLHLLYSRFWHKFLYDIGVVPTKEPYQKRTSHGMILGTNGEKMSKSKGNVINPDDIVNEFGADTFRIYEMFMGPFDQVAAWSMESIRGCGKFLDRVWNMQNMLVDGDNYSKETEKMMHKAIKKVSQDIEDMKFNTSVSTFMTMVNEFYKIGKVNKAEFKTFLTLLNPFAPHITEELNKIAGFDADISTYSWPEYDEAKTVDDEITLPIQFNGKLKATITISVDEDESSVKEKVHNAIDSKLDGKTIVKEIYVKNRIYNVVVK